MRAVFLSCLLASLLAACASSPPARYYTLVAPAAEPAEQGSQGSLRGDMIDVVSVTVPVQIDQPQLMLRDGGGQVVPYYSDRWSGPLPDEFRGALSDALTRRLGVPDVREVRPSSDAPVWRVLVDVQRFDATLGGPVVLDATWRVRLAGGSRTEQGVLCRSRVDTLAASPDVGGVVAAQQQSVQQLADAIASVIQAGGARAPAAGDNVQTLGCTKM